MAGRTENLKPWKPGQSGNPGGRPKRFALTDALREELEKRCPGDKGRRSNAEVIAEVLVREARRGNIRAAKEIIDRVEGKPINANEMDKLHSPHLSIQFCDAILENYRERKRQQQEQESCLVTGESALKKLPE